MTFDVGNRKSVHKLDRSDDVVTRAVDWTDM